MVLITTTLKDTKRVSSFGSVAVSATVYYSFHENKTKPPFRDLRVFAQSAHTCPPRNLGSLSPRNPPSLSCLRLKKPPR